MDDLFHAIDSIFAGLEGGFTVWGADGDGDAALPDFKVTDAVHHGDIVDGPFLPHLVGNLLQLSAERVRQIEREAFGKLRDSDVIAAAAGY